MGLMKNVAEHIIQKCGGAQAVAQMLGISPVSVHKWKYALEKGGSGGLIPTARQQELLRAAKERGIKLRPADFFDDAKSSEAA
jgi:transposase